MTLGREGYVSIAELIIYVPTAVGAFIVCRRHGILRSSGWIFLPIFCLIRIAGAICQLVTYTDPSDGLYKAVVTLNSIGLSPLLLATLGIISRLTNWMILTKGQLISSRVFRLIQLVITIGLILTIAGSTTSSSSNGNPKPTSTLKAGVILYVVAFVAMTLVFIRALPQRRLVPETESRIPLAIALAWPFIAVRLVYSLLAIFIYDDTFSLVGGSVAVRAGMSVAEEMVVILVYTALGWTLQRLEPTLKRDNGQV